MVLFQDVDSPLTNRGATHYSQWGQFPVGLIAQLVELCTGIGEVMGSIPVKAGIF